MSQSKLWSILLCVAICGACGGGGPPPVAGQEVEPDTEAPTSAASPESGNFAQPTEVELTTSEPATVYVSIDGADFAPAGESPVTITLDEGTTTLRYYAVDPSGNVEDPIQTQVYLLDLSPPQLALTGPPPEPLPWLETAAVEWQSDEECDYVVTVVETGEPIGEGKLDAGATAIVEYPALDLPEDPITVRVKATDWTGRSSTLEFTLARRAPVVVSADATPGSVVVAPGGDRAFVARPFGTEIDVVDLATEEVVETIDVGIRAWAITLNADGSLIYVSNAVATGAIATVDVDSYDVEKLDIDVGVPGAVSFSSDGAFGFFTDFAGSIRVLDTDPASADYHTIVDTFFVEDDALAGRIVVSPQGDRLVVNWSGIDTVGVSVVDLGASGPDARIAWLSSTPPFNALAQAIASSADGASVFVSSVTLLCGLCRFDVDDDKLVHAGEDPDPAPDSGVIIGGKKVPDIAWDLALLDADAWLLTVGPNGRFVRLYDAGTMEHRSRFRIGTGASAVAVTPDGTRAIIARSSGATNEIVLLPLH